MVHGRLSMALSLRQNVSKAAKEHDAALRTELAAAVSTGRVQALGIADPAMRPDQGAGKAQVDGRIKKKDLKSFDGSEKSYREQLLAMSSSHNTIQASINASERRYLEQIRLLRSSQHAVQAHLVAQRQRVHQLIAQSSEMVAMAVAKAVAQAGPVGQQQGMGPLANPSSEALVTAVTRAATKAVAETVSKVELELMGGAASPVYVRATDGRPPAGCRGDEPIFWTPSAACRAQPAACGKGNMSFALSATMVPRCGAGGSKLRHFDRATTLECFKQLGHHRIIDSKPTFRILFAGVSNMLHAWHAMVQDDSLIFEKMPNMRHKNAPDSRKNHCPPVVPDLRLKAYAPHHVDYMTVQILTPGVVVHRRTAPSCWRRGAIGGGALTWMTNATRTPYDVVAILVGSWDGAFTERFTADIESSWEADIEHMLLVWPRTVLILATLTPCGGTNSTSPLPERHFTPRQVCRWIDDFNAVVHRLVERQASPRVMLLDAHQMTVSRPGVDIAGTPPGIWQDQRAGVHFAATETRRARDEARRMDPPSAAGEMNRAIANRVLDMVCPALE